MKILQNSKDILIPYLTHCINAAIKNCNFPNDLKVADVSAGYKRGVQIDGSNYRPMSVLTPISKIFERLIGSQFSVFVENNCQISYLHSEKVIVRKMHY